MVKSWILNLRIPSIKKISRNEWRRIREGQRMNRKQISFAIALIHSRNHETIQLQRNNQRYQGSVVIIISNRYSRYILCMYRSTSIWVFLTDAAW